MKYVKIFWIYMGIVGMVTFPLFILEESIQTATWGTWAAKEAKDNRLMLKGIIVIEKINVVLQTINSTLGWIQPLSMLGYDGYAQATDIYVQSVRSRILAQEPEIFVGQKISFEFLPKEIQVLADGKFSLQNGKITVIVDKWPEAKIVSVSGTMHEIDGKLVVRDGS